MPCPAPLNRTSIAFNSPTSYRRPTERHTFKAAFDVNLIHEVMINLFQGGGIYAYNGAAQTAFNNWIADVAGINLATA